MGHTAGSTSSDETSFRRPDNAVFFHHRGKPIPARCGARNEHWLVTGVPLVLMSPVLGLQYDLSTDALLILTASLLLGTPVLSLIGAIGAALTLGLRGGGVLVSLLVLPLYIPVLIFGAGAVEASTAGLGAGAHLSLLGAFLLASLVLSPWATAVSLRISME